MLIKWFFVIVREGQNNKILGRKRVIDRSELLRLKESGMSVKAIVEKTGISRSSYYNVIGDAQ